MLRKIYTVIENIDGNVWIHNFFAKEEAIEKREELIEEYLNDHDLTTDVDNNSRYLIELHSNSEEVSFSNSTSIWFDDGSTPVSFDIAESYVDEGESNLEKHTDEIIESSIDAGNDIFCKLREYHNNVRCDVGNCRECISATLKWLQEKH